MDINQFLEAFNPLPGKDYGPDDYQKRVICQEKGPIWVIAGPGSGKTDSIVLRCLKLLAVDRIPPSSIILTTFTEKAARNLADRIAIYMEHLINVDATLRDIDYTRLRLGTLHSICNDVMQEFRFRGYQNYRLLSDMEQRLFITEHSNLTAIGPDDTQLAIWRNLPYLVNGYDPVGGGRWNPNRNTFPNRWVRARATQVLFNRIVEDRIDVERMRTSDGFWPAVAEAYVDYRDRLFALYRCDFSHLQAKFMDFLESTQGRLFVDGKNDPVYPGITHVLVDEYQDTNPIQEKIYHLLSARPPHNLCVVGDDDQALYRFRGGTVECMVNFQRGCEGAWNDCHGIQQLPLPVNYRSHPKIVRFCDSYVQSFQAMSVPGARIEGKLPLETGSTIHGDYPAVALLTRRNTEDVAANFALLIENFLGHGIIAGPGDCALLMRSTRATARNALPFMDALETRGIQYYNPRSRALLEQEEVAAALGAFLEIVDPRRQAQNAIRVQGIMRLANGWRTEYLAHSARNPELAEYVNRAAAAIGTMGPSSSVGCNMIELLYHVLSYPPFVTWIEDPQRSRNIGVVTQVFEAFSKVPPGDNPRRMMGDLYTSGTPGGGVSFAWRKRLYYSLLGILAGEGLNEPEDPDDDVPTDRLPIMTIHQAKGLQFPIVFVSSLSPGRNQLDPGTSILLERDLYRFRRLQYPADVTMSSEEKANQDLVRSYYVAFSRSQCSLILMASNSEISRGGVGLGPTQDWLQGHVDTI